MTRFTIPSLAPLLSLTLLSLIGCAGEPAEEARDVAVEAGYAEEIAAWQEEREADLRKPDSWLSLVGLFWLEEGENTCGSGEDADVTLPASTAARVGVLRLADGVVELAAEAGVEITKGGEPVTRAVLASDAEGAPDVLELGTVSFHVITRGEKVGVRIKDSASPTLQAFTGIESYAVDPGWRVEGRFVAYEPAKTLGIPTVLDTVVESESPGAVEIEVDGTTHRIDALPGGPDGELFLLFGDATNGKETYGGGRFLTTAAPAADGRVTVDFNKAYNPPCAFTPYATCPLPPQQNRLQLAVLAGEKSYGEGHH